MPLSKDSERFIGLQADSRIVAFAGWLCLLLIGATVYSSPRWFFLSSNDVIWLRVVQSKPPLALAWEQFAVGSPLDYRPLASLYFLALQVLFGDWAPGYYAFSLLLHTLNALLVFFVARTFRLSWQLAALAALFFLLHPAPVRAVRWVNDAANLLQTCFLLLSLLLAWRFLVTGGKRPYWLSLACAAAAVFSKESGIVALVLPPVLDLCLRGLRPLKRFARYAPHGLIVAFYLCLYVSIAHSPGWRSHPEVLGIGSHVPRNLAYGVGFAWLPLDHPSPLLSSFLVFLGMMSPVAVVTAFRDRRLGVFALSWLLLCALPTALFRTTGGLASTGRYVYFFLPPLLLAAAGWAERAGEALRQRRWRSRLVLASLLLLGLATGLRTRRLAAAPFETHAGPVLYHFAVMWILDYREATSYVLNEFGCPGPRSLEEASSWGAALAAQAKEPALQVLARVVTALAESSLGRTTAAMSELDEAARILAGQPANLVSGSALGSHHISRLKQRLAVSPLLPVCRDASTSPF
ncbi:MAG TPA: hypothetical protein VFS12_10530 [Terriglobia bacterium]|nr:hypothetical protein [Terriglobia bacterium]